MAESPGRAGPTLVTAAATPQTILSGGASTAVWAILREVAVTNVAAVAVVFSLGLSTANSNPPRWVYNRTLQPGDDPWSWGGFIPLIGHATTPDLFYVVCDTANAIAVTTGHVLGP